jgi:hypothetical protein
VCLAVAGGAVGAAQAAMGPLALNTAAISMMERPRCVYGFNKDACDSRWDATDATIRFETSCSSPDLPECKTLSVRNMSWKGGLNSHTGTCSNAVDSPCDEFKPVTGFTANVDFDLDVTGDRCRYRGCWNATSLTFYNQQGPLLQIVIDASAAGTLGVGSHRKVDCQSPIDPPLRCGRDCERCLDVEFIPLENRWRIGLEGHVRGTVVSGPQVGAEVCVMISGDLYAKGDANGISNVLDGFDFCGSFDGVTIYYCD